MPEKTITPLRAIRLNCLDCVKTSHEVALCPIESCPLYPFRFGKNPYRTQRQLTDEQKAFHAEVLKNARLNKTSKQLDK